MCRQAPLTKSKGTEIGVQKGPKCAKPCKMCTNKKTNTFFGCPGRPHFQNAQTLECAEHKNVQNHAKCAQLKKQKLFWMPRQAPLTKRTEIGVQKAQKCAQKNLLVWMDAQASSTSKTHRTWSVKSTKMCKTMQNVHNSKSKNFFGCPGKLHLQNAQKLECKKPKNVHKKNYLFGWMPRQAPLTKRTELGV